MSCGIPVSLRPFAIALLLVPMAARADLPQTLKDERALRAARLQGPAPRSGPWRVVTGTPTISLGASSTTDLFDSTSGHWFELPPPLRRDHSMIYDPARARLIVFGGQDINPRNDVWEYSIPTREWYRIDAQGPAPAPRYYHSAMYDPVRDRMLVFGGAVLDGGTWHLGNDVWSLSLAPPYQWTQLTTPTSPPARYGSAVVFDPIADRMIVFGGQGNGLLGDVWSLALGGTPAWSPILPAGSAPAERNYHGAVFDSLRNRVLIYGGRGASSDLADLWALELTGGPHWTMLSPGGTPPPGRSHPGVALDQAGDRLLLFAGASTNFIFENPLNDLWALGLTAGGGWSRIDGSSVFPGLRAHHAVAFDPQRHQLLTYGGEGDSTAAGSVWAFQLGPAPTWTRLAPATDWPAGYNSGSLTYDPLRHRAIVFGGFGPPGFSNETWAMTLGPYPSWTRLPTEGERPLPRYDHSAVYDPGDDRLVVFGGYTTTNGLANDVWTLSLTPPHVWSHLAPAGSAPSGRFRHTAVYDPIGGRMLVFGGQHIDSVTSLEYYTNDAWALSLRGAPTWSLLHPGGTAPAPRGLHAATFDPFRQRMLVYGGFSYDYDYGEAVYFADMWALQDLEDSVRWVPVGPMGSGPGARMFGAMIEDVTRYRAVLFGGSDGMGPVADVWSLASYSYPWRHLSPGGAGPGEMYYAHAIYDPQDDRAIVMNSFGGVFALSWKPPFVVSAPPIPATRPEMVVVTPNPSTGPVALRYSLTRPGAVRIVIRDVAGRTTRELVNEPEQIGSQLIWWDGTDQAGRLQPPGVYLCEGVLGTVHFSRRLIRLR